MKMKVVIFVVFTALLGIASCDLLCMQFKLSKCFSSNAFLHSNNPLCGSHNELLECLRNVARECGEETTPIVKETIESYAKTCKEGTDMNDLYQKHKTCVFQEAERGNFICLRPILSEVLSMGLPANTRSYQLKVMKVACKYGDSGNKCIDDNINATCGAEAAQFRRRLSESSIKLSNQACVEVAAATETEPDTNDIYARQQHSEHSVHVMSPHTQHLSAAGSQAGSIQIASTVAPMQFQEHLLSGAPIIASMQLIYILAAAIAMKWFSPY